MPTVRIISDYLARFAPLELAAEWDNVGLLFGDPRCEVQSLLTCLTITSEVVSEAIETGVQLIVAHHPILFRGTKRLNLNEADGRLLWPLARAGISVYSPHTSFDNCVDGINDILCKRLGLLEVEPLRRGSVQRYKVVVFVPEADLQKVADALFEAGAGRIGDYSQCSFRLSGTGTFFGSYSTNPSIGQKGRREEVGEHRLEVVCGEKALEEVLRAMRRAHSYEEPAFDVYPLKIVSGEHGEGRVGRLPKPISLEELAKIAKRELHASGVQLVGDRLQTIERVAIACGAAGEFLKEAFRAKADVFLTGEMRFHDYLEAKALPIALILPGHYASERTGVEELATRLLKQWPGLRVEASRRETDPVTWV